MSVALPCDRSLFFNAPVKNPFLTVAEMDSRLKAPGCVANAAICWTAAGPAAENRWQIRETGIQIHETGALHQVMQGDLIANAHLPSLCQAPVRRSAAGRHPQR